MSTITKITRATCRMWIPLVVLALTLTAMTWPRSREAKRKSSSVMDRIVAARLTDVPSHNRLFRGSLVLTSDSVWVLRLRSASGAPVRTARVAMEAWMPEEDGAGRAAPGALDYTGAGDYRLRPIALDRPGWWNVRVQIAAAGRTDSLAFNVILR